MFNNIILYAYIVKLALGPSILAFVLRILILTRINLSLNYIN